ncbi:MAG: ABC transporter permease [Lachnospiraceae bacterium]|jgi:simple sugar transport system permease protein|nr:ABC transporter permease [Lachnospiraceae bacterium]
METIIIDGLSFALPIMIIAVGGIYSERSGITNLALEGLLGFGAFSGGLFVALMSGYFAPASPTLIWLSFLIAMIGGAIYSMLHALLCIKFQANQVISGVVINILSVAITGFLTSQINTSVFGKPSDKFVLSVFQRITIPGLSKIPVIGAVFKDFYPFEVLIIVLIIICWYILYCTPFGMHLRACGDNPQAVDTAGINVNKVRFIAVLFSGALSGIGGMCFAYSISTNFSPAVYMGAGYLAISALIFGNWKIMPTFLACLIFGFARSGAYQVVKYMKLSSSFSDLAMTIPYILTLLLLVFFSKNNRAPRALGEIYDKGKR